MESLELKRTIALLDSPQNALQYIAHSAFLMKNGIIGIIMYVPLGISKVDTLKFSPSDCGVYRRNRLANSEDIYWG